MKNIFHILFLLPILFSCQSEKVVTVYPNQVGDIVFDKNQDDPNFKRCMDKDYGIQYYNDSHGFQYKGEKIEIVQALEKLKLSASRNTNGYVTDASNPDGGSGNIHVLSLETKHCSTSALFIVEFFTFADFTTPL